jgi:hypothetical protein
MIPRIPWFAQARPPKYDAQFKVVFDTLRQLMKPPESRSKRRIAFALGARTEGGMNRRL